MIFVENNSEDVIEAKISDMWIYVGESFYDFESIAKYSTAYQWDNALFIRIYLKRKWVAVLDIKLDNQILWDIQNILDQYIENSGKTELSQTDKIIRLLNL